MRFYEQKGLLSPARRGWTRLFSYRDRARLQLILRGKRVGFALEEIKEMLDLYNLKDGQLTQLRVASTKLKDRLVGLKKQRHEIEEAIADLERTCDIVDGMLKERETALPLRRRRGKPIGGRIRHVGPRSAQTFMDDRGTRHAGRPVAPVLRDRVPAAL